MKNATHLMLALAVATAATGCKKSDPIPINDLDIAVCAPSAGPFTLAIDNEFFPLPLGHFLLLEGEEDGAELQVLITVLDETETVAGVVTRVVEERETEDGELVEVSRNFFAQAPDGTVCYFGEDVDIYEDGAIVSHDGAWRADGVTNLPGIMMPADPKLGDRFMQEFAPGVAEDRGWIVGVGERTKVPAGTFTDTLSITEDSPLDAGISSEKVYAAGIGLIVDEPVELVSHQ